MHNQVVAFSLLVFAAKTTAAKKSTTTLRYIGSLSNKYHGV